MRQVLIRAFIRLSIDTYICNVIKTNEIVVRRVTIQQIDAIYSSFIIAIGRTTNSFVVDR